MPLHEPYLCRIDSGIYQGLYFSSTGNLPHRRAIELVLGCGSEQNSDKLLTCVLVQDLYRCLANAATTNVDTLAMETYTKSIAAFRTANGLFIDLTCQSENLLFPLDT